MTYKILDDKTHVCDLPEAALFNSGATIQCDCKKVYWRASTFWKHRAYWSDDFCW